MRLPKISVPLYLRLALAAIAVAPLQQAFTMNIGSPLKPSELLMVLSILLWTVSSKRKSPPGEFKFIIGILIVLVFSTLYQLTKGAPTGDYLGYSRSPDNDLLFYAVYPIFILFIWRVASEVPHGMFQRAIKLSIWICLAGIVLQVSMMQIGRIDILEFLSYETKIRSVSLSGSGEGTMRNGTFTEGQHLGFFSAISVLVAWRARAYITALAALAALAYSQSTTGLVGLIVVILILVLVRPSTSAAIKIGVGAAAAIAVVTMVDTLRNLVFLQIAKLGVAPGLSQVQDATASLDVRTLKIEIAWRMMWEHPLLGVGPGRFGYWYLKDPASADSPYWYFLPEHRTIAENVYMQIGSELGIVALFLFLLFMWRLYVRIRKCDRTLIGIYLLVAIGIATQSSWTFIPIWIFLAFLASAADTS